MAQLVKVAEKSQIPEGEGIAVRVGNERIAVFNSSGKYFAVSDTCPHAGGPLSEGWVEDNEVTCPWHGWTFQLDCGNGADGICRYKVHVEGEDIKIELPE